MHKDELQEGWKQVTIGDIAELVTSGATPRVGNTKLYSDHNSGIPFLRIQNVGVNHLVLSDLKFITKEVHDSELKRSQLHPGDVLVTITGRLGTSAVVPHEIMQGNVNQHICLIRVKQEVADPYYVSFHLNSEETHREIMQKQHGATRIALNHHSVSSLRISLPPLETQRRIATILGRARGLIEMRERANQLTNKIIQSVFLRMFGTPGTNPRRWKITELSNITRFVGGGTPSTSNQEYYNGTIPWVTPKDMKSLVINDTQDHITEEAIAQSSTKLIDPEHVLMVVRSGILKKHLPLAINSVPVAINQDMKALYHSVDIDPYYLLFHLITLTKEILQTVRATTADNLSSDVLKATKIMVPPLANQKRFSLMAKRVITLQHNQEVSTMGISQLFESLSDKAFRGELTSAKASSKA